MNDTLKRFVKCLSDKGFGPQVIKSSYCESIRTEDEMNEIIELINSHPEWDNNEINYQIHKISLRRCGVDI